MILWKSIQCNVYINLWETRLTKHNLDFNFLSWNYCLSIGVLMQTNGIILTSIYFHIQIENSYSHWLSSIIVDMKWNRHGFQIWIAWGEKLGYDKTDKSFFFSSFFLFLFWCLMVVSGSVFWLLNFLALICIYNHSLGMFFVHLYSIYVICYEGHS